MLYCKDGVLYSKFCLENASVLDVGSLFCIQELDEGVVLKIETSLDDPNQHLFLESARALEDFDSIVNDCLIPFSLYCLMHWKLYPCWDNLQILYHDQKFLITRPSKFTAQYSKFCLSVAQFTLQFIECFKSYGTTKLVMNINKKPKWKSHTCKVPFRCGGIVQHLSNNNPDFHNVVCTDTIGLDWLVRWCNLFQFPTLWANQCGST